MATAALCSQEEHVLQEQLRSIEGIEAVYIAHKEAHVSVLVVVPTKDYELEKRIHGARRRVLSICPDIRLDFNILVRRGRLMNDIVSDENFQLLKIA